MRLVCIVVRLFCVGVLEEVDAVDRPHRGEVRGAAVERRPPWPRLYVLCYKCRCQLILYIISFTSAGFNNFYKQFMLRQQIKKQFETYLDPRQVMLLQKDPSLLKLGGERKEMTFLFMDICGFTPISEHYKNKNDPEGLVMLVNEFLDEMTKIILRNGGTIDKYMGDCIMAFWNAPIPCEKIGRAHV